MELSELRYVLVPLLWLLVGFAMGRWSRRRPPAVAAAPQAVSRLPSRTADELRAAVHEAGHALVAWHSPFVEAITRVSIEDGERGTGRMIIQHRVPLDDISGRAEWHGLAVMLGGLAAEAACYGRLRSGSSAHDLLGARRMAQQLSDMGQLDAPPWEVVLPAKTLDVASMYRSSPSESEAAILATGYARARSLVDQDRARFDELVRVLAERGVARRAEVEAIFGKRPRFPL